MSATAGYAGTVKITGVAVALSSEATTLSGVNPTKRFTITNTARRVLSPDHEISLYDGIDLVDSDAYTINYAAGYGEFISYMQVEDITVNGYYLPTYTVAQVKSASIQLDRDVLDASIIGGVLNSAQSVMGLIKCSGTVELVDDFVVDYDTDTGGDQSLLADFLAANHKVIELNIGSDLYKFFCLFNGLDETWTVKDLYKRSLKWTGSKKVGTYGTAESYGFSFQ